MPPECLPILLHLLIPVFKSPAFWIPVYLAEIVKYAPADAAKFSLLFPFFGGISVICYGFISDNKMRGKK